VAGSRDGQHGVTQDLTPRISTARCGRPLLHEASEASFSTRPRTTFSLL
jgi:hypothetical protein